MLSFVLIGLFNCQPLSQGLQLLDSFCPLPFHIRNGMAVIANCHVKCPFIRVLGTEKWTLVSFSVSLDLRKAVLGVVCQERCLKGDIA